LAVVFWATLSAGFVGFELYGRGVVTISPRDLDRIFQVDAPSGTWVSVTGFARHRPDYSATLLIDTASHRFLNTGGGRYAKRPQLDANGTRAVWSAYDRSASSWELMTADLERDPPIAVRTGIADPMRFLLSPDGTRVAVFDQRSAKVYELPSGKIVGATALGGQLNLVSAVVFLSPDRIRMYLNRQVAPRGVTYDILEFDAKAGTLETTGRMHGRGIWLHPELSLSGLLISEWRSFGHRISLCDPRTGTPTRTLVSEEARTSLRDVTKLSDGGFVMGTREPDGTRLRILGKDADEERQIALPGDYVRLGAEYAPGKLALEVGKSTGDGDEGTLYLADLDTGEVRPASERLSLPRPWPWDWIPRQPIERAAGSLASRLYLSADSALVLYDPVTSTRRTLLGPDRGAGR
jgi:hypothetical protein